MKKYRRYGSPYLSNLGCCVVLHMLRCRWYHMSGWNIILRMVNITPAWKVSKYRVFSGPYFVAFGLNTRRYSVSLPIQSECGKRRIRKNSVFGHFSRSDTWLKNFVLRKATFLYYPDIILLNLPKIFKTYLDNNITSFKKKRLKIFA